MHIVPLAWLYVALMMAVAEANHSKGTLLGACITFLLYGVLPVTVVMYLMGAPARNRAAKAREAAQRDAARAAAQAAPQADAAPPAESAS